MKMKLARRSFLAGVSAFALMSQAQARFPRGSSAALAQWQPLRIGAGGFLRSMDIAMSDNTMVCRADTYGCYLWVPGLVEPGPGSATGMWQQLVSINSLPSGDPATAIYYGQLFGSNLGTYEVRIAPSNTQILYMLNLGYFYTSSNRGTTWNATTWGPVNAGTMAANDGYSQYGPKMAVDPINPNRVFFGVGGGGTSNNNQFYKTLDGGGNFTTVSTSSIAQSSSSGGGYGVAFDPRVSEQSGGNSQVIYVFSYGTGCYVSTDAGSTWAKISGSGTSATGLTTFRRMLVDVNGVLYVTDDSGALDNLWYYSGGSWTQVTALSAVNNSGSPYHSIAIDPTVPNAQRVVLGDAGGVLTQSTTGVTGSWTGSDGGGVPNGGNASGQIASDIPYLTLGDSYFDNGCQVFDSNGTLWESEGVGVWHATPPNSSLPNGAWYWNSQSAGIEQLVVSHISSVPGGYPIVACWDRAFFTITDPHVYRSTYQPPTFVNAPGGFCSDWAAGTPGYVAAPQHGGILNYSTDYGVNWNTYSGLPAVANGVGTIAATTSSNLVWAEGVGGTSSQLYYSIHGGADWTPSPAAISSGTYNSSTGLVTLTLSAPITFGDAGNQITLSGLTATPYTIISATYNNSTGLVTITLGSSASFANGTNMTVAMTGSGTNIGQLDGAFTSASVSGTTVTFSAAAGLNTGSGVTAISITGGSVGVVANLDGAYASISASGTSVTYNGPTGLGTLSITGGALNGVTWNALGSYFTSTLGVAAGGWSPWCLCADRVNTSGGGTFYVLNRNTFANGGGIYKSTNGGQTWALQTTGSYPFPSEGTLPILRSVPGQAGHLFYTGGQNFNNNHPQAYYLWRSSDGGATWSKANTLINEPWVFGFGAAAPGASYPTVYFWGWYNGVPGVWSSIDDCVSFQQIGSINMYGTLDQPSWLEGDNNVPARCYVGLTGSGCAYYGT